MKNVLTKILLTNCLFLVYYISPIFLYSQTNNLDTIPIQIKLHYPLGYEQDRNQYDSILNILKEDVIKYYHLEETFDTELKLKQFKNTEDYKQKLELIRESKKNLYATSFSIDVEAHRDYFGKDIHYDLFSKSFTITCDGRIIDSMDILFFDYISFLCPKGYKLNEEGMSFTILDEGEAQKIEENRDKLRIKYSFKFIGVNNNLGYYYNNGEATYLIADVQKVLLYSSETNEEYPIYMESKTTKDDLKEISKQKNIRTNSKKKEYINTPIDLEGKVFVSSKSKDKTLKKLQFIRNNQVQLYVNDVLGDNILHYSIKNGIIIIQTIKNLSIRYQILNNKQLKQLHSSFLGNSKLEGNIYNIQN